MYGNCDLAFNTAIDSLARSMPRAKACTCDCVCSWSACSGLIASVTILRTCSLDKPVGVLLGPDDADDDDDVDTVA